VAELAWGRAMKLALLGLVACGAIGCKGTLRGQVALKSENGVVEVRVFTEKELAPWLAAHAEDIRQARAEKLQEVSDASAEINKLEWNRDRLRSQGSSGSASKDDVVVEADAVSESRNAYRYTYDPHKSTGREAEDKARQALDTARANYAWNRAAYQNARAGFEHDLSLERQRSEQARQQLAAWQASVFDDLPPGGQGIITDPQGRFAVRVPRRGRVAILVSGVFEQYGRFVPLSWALWVSLERESSAELRLDANNTLASTTANSVFGNR
jgi:hypothetical protein